MLYQPPPFQCNVPISAYVVICSFLLIGRVYATSILWKLSYDLRRRKTQGKKRIPIQAISATLQTLILTLFFILAGTNIVSSLNGTSGIFFFLWCVVRHSQLILQLRKIVQLGIKIYPIALKNLEISTIDRVQSSAARFDLLLKFNTIILGLCIIGYFWYVLIPSFLPLYL